MVDCIRHGIIPFAAISSKNSLSVDAASTDPIGGLVIWTDDVSVTDSALCITYNTTTFDDTFDDSDTSHGGIR
jgi:hypothetical protein